jgi:3-hydroxybutyryl-CoA dehydrogenase
MAGKRHAVLLTGEMPLITAIGELCHSAGMRTDVRLPKGAGRKGLPRWLTSGANPGSAYAAAFELTLASREEKKKNIARLDKLLKPSIPILSTSVTVSVAEQAGWVRYPGRLTGISAFPTLTGNKVIEVAPGPATDRRVLDSGCSLLASLGKECMIIQDRVGMVLPRILCMLINEAFFGSMEQIADPASIDLAMKLGTNYPRGPIEWAGEIGPHYVVAVLKSLYDELGDDRYRISPLLRECGRISGQERT